MKQRKHVKPTPRPLTPAQKEAYERGREERRRVIARIKAEKQSEWQKRKG